MAVLESPYWNAIYPEIRRLLVRISRQSFSNDFYLAGGTGLALQIGHRRSEDIALASLADIGLMKCDALISRGSRKDFYDLYFIDRVIPIEKLLLLAEKKYVLFRDFPLMVLESMILFDNADRDVSPDLFENIPWEQVKQFFLQQARLLSHSWFKE